MDRSMIDEAMTLGDTEARDLALQIRDLKRAHEARRLGMLWDLSAKISHIKRPDLEISDIVTVVDAAPDEEAQLQTVMVRLPKMGKYDALLVELAIATIGPHDTDAIIDFVNPLDVQNIKYIKAASGRRLFECTSCEDHFPAKDLVTTTCGHCYCGECLKLVFNAAISDESLYPPSCCAHTPIPIEHAKRFLDRGFEETFEEKGVEFNTVDRTYCSDPTCSTFIPPAAIRRGTAYCWICDKTTCVVCKTPGHEGDCPTDLELAAMLKYAEEMHWQRCYSCFSVVQRWDGRNHMECRCGAAFCYTCGRELSHDEESRCPCQNVEPPPYSFYRRPADRSQPPDSPRTIWGDEWTHGPAEDWDLPELDPDWNFPEEDGEDLVQQEQDMSRAGTPDIPRFVAPQAVNQAWDTGIAWDFPPQAENLAWGAEAIWNFANGEQASIVDSRRSRTPDVETVQDTAPPDADVTLPPVTSNAALFDALRQLVAVVSAEYPVLLIQNHENEVPVGTGPASLRDSASNHLSLESDGDSQHTRSQTTGEDTPRQERFSDVQLSDHPNSAEEPAQSDHNGEDTPEHQTSDSSTISMKPTRHGRLRTRLSPRGLLRVLREA
ncbi:hypothetical protein KCU73_g8485, partial [Aureobasidium melanogenum]